MYNAPMSSKESKKFIKKLHPNLWKHYQEQYKISGQVDLRHDTGDIARYRNLKSIFDVDTIAQIKQYLDEGKTGSWTKYYYGNKPHLGRDYSVELSYSPNGVFQGFFSSEYSGYGNGDYYLLVNEDTAIFIEKD